MHTEIRPIGAVAEVVIDVRVIAATHRDLAEEVAHGRFRADLYARLTESVVTLEPLRDRPENLEPLWTHFVKDVAAFLNKDRKQIYRWLRRANIDPDIDRPESRSQRLATRRVSHA